MKHAKFSASGSHRWLQCTASLFAENASGVKRTQHVSANIGNKLHTLAAKELVDYIKDVSTFSFKYEHPVELLEEYKQVGEFSYANKEKVIQDYVNYIASYIYKDCKVYIETPVSYDNYAPNGFGTPDCVILVPEYKSVHVHDLKTGNGYVEVEDNPQLLMYLLGVYQNLENPEEFEHFHAHIIQPSINNIKRKTYTKDEILEFGEYVKKRSLEALTMPKFRPSKEACQWCTFRAKCRPLNDYLQGVVSGEVFGKEANELTPQERGEILKNKGLIESFLNAVEESTTDYLTAGNTIEGLKLVRGIARRKWKDEALVAKELAEVLNEEELYERKLIGVSAAEKIIGKEDFKQLFEKLVIKPEGALKCVLETDRRKSVEVGSGVGSDFD